MPVFYSQNDYYSFTDVVLCFISGSFGVVYDGGIVLGTGIFNGSYFAFFLNGTVSSTSSHRQSFLMSRLRNLQWPLRVVLKNLDNKLIHNTYWWHSLTLPSTYSLHGGSKGVNIIDRYLVKYNWPSHITLKQISLKRAGVVT